MSMIEDPTIHFLFQKIYGGESNLIFYLKISIFFYICDYIHLSTLALLTLT
jgi:hypothetical protein